MHYHTLNRIEDAKERCIFNKPSPIIIKSNINIKVMKINKRLV